MARVVMLGSAALVNDAEHDYTHLLLIGEEDSPILINAGENPLGKIKDLGLQDEALQDVIFTHFQADIVGGLPNMFMHMWLQGRRASMRLYGLPHCLGRIQSLLSFHGWELWPNFFPVSFLAVQEAPAAPVLENRDFRIFSYPVLHHSHIPTIGLRIENKHTGRIISYSSETEPHENVVGLGHNADVLIHEAAGELPGHSSARQAGEIATAAGAHALGLIHYQVWDADPNELEPEARSTYDGPIKILRDMDEIEF